MLRAILGFALLVAVAGLAFLLGRSTSQQAQSAREFVMPPPLQKEIQTRARTTLPEVEAPDIRPQTDLTGPTVLMAPSEEGNGQPLGLRGIALPIAGLKRAQIIDTYYEARGDGQRTHEATDIMAPRGTPVLAVDDGVVKKLFTSQYGGLTVYQFDSAELYTYYYAHLDRYAEGLKEGMLVKRGDLIGYVGSTGNADPNAPHLHFAIFELGPEKNWWQGKPFNPYPLLIRAFK